MCRGIMSQQFVQIFLLETVWGDPHIQQLFQYWALQSVCILKGMKKKQRTALCYLCFGKKSALYSTVGLDF